MADIVHALKTRARLLQKQIADGDPGAVKKTRTIKELSKLDDETIAVAVKRRHCLTIVARECGFNGWSHLTAVILHNDISMGLGTLMRPGRCWVHWNVWFADYEEARKVRIEHGGYLLGYKNQFLIVDEDYINSLGFDSKDQDLAKTGRDWIYPDDLGARRNLFAQLIRTVHTENPLQPTTKIPA